MLNSLSPSLSSLPAQIKRPASLAVRRWANLDVIRGVAILMVLCCHSPILIPFLGNIGWLGVDLFFVLSGFLVSGLLFQEFKSTGRIDVLRFYVRRAAKIYPLFWLLLIVAPWIFSGQSLQAWLAELFLVQNYFPGMFLYTWSLAVEEHFYLALPLLLVFLVKQRRGNNPFSLVPWIALGSLAVCSLLRYLTSLQLDQAHITSLIALRRTHLRGDELMIGVAAGYFYAYQRQSTLRVIKRWHLVLTMMPAICGAMALWLTSTLITYSVGIPLLAAGGAAMVFTAAAGSGSAVGIAGRFLASVGRISYALYLFHIPVSTILLRLPLVRSNTASILVTYFAGSIAVAWALTKYCEQPILTLRDRYFPARTATLRYSPPVREAEPTATHHFQIGAVK